VVEPEPEQSNVGGKHSDRTDPTSGEVEKAEAHARCSAWKEAWRLPLVIDVRVANPKQVERKAKPEVRRGRGQGGRGAGQFGVVKNGK